MTDVPASPEFPAYEPPPPTITRKASWTPDQLARVDYEWRRLQRNFAYHPAVRVVPLEGEPPSKYEFNYQLRSLGYNEAGQLDYLTHCGVTVELPGAFPHAAPIVRPIGSLFHPNISVEAQQVAIYPEWTAGDTLEDVLLRVGAMLTFETVDTYGVWNPVAMQWVKENANYLPTDSAANLTPDADGGPVKRIARGAGATIHQLRGQMHEICVSMLDVGDPPTMADIREFSQRARMVVSLFVAADLPPELSAPALELQALAAQLPQAAPAFELLRSLKAHTITSLTAEAELAGGLKYLNAQLVALEKMVQTPPPTDPYAAMRQLPSTDDLKMALEVLRGLLLKAEQKHALVRQWLPSLREPQRQPGFPPVLQDVFDTEALRLASEVNEARVRLQATARAGEPVIDRTRHEVAALDQLLRWKEFSDLTEKGHSLVMKAEMLGAAGLQAYFVAMGDAEYGPFEFDQQVDLGVASLAIRNPAPRALELIDLATGRRVAASDTGQMGFNIAGETAGESYPAVFRLTVRCDELYLPLDHVIRQSQALLLRATARPVDAPSWCAKYTAALVAGSGAVNAEYRSAVVQWAQLLADLKAVAAFKERLATYYLIKRVAEHAPRYLADRAAAAASEQQATGRIADILSRSSKDSTSGQVIMPARLHAEYGQRLDQRNQAREKIARFDKLLKNIAAQIRTRLASKVLAGTAGAPTLTTLSPLPDDLLGAVDLMTDDSLAHAVMELQNLLQINLLPAVPPPPPGTAMPRLTPPPLKAAPAIPPPPPTSATPPGPGPVTGPRRSPAPPPPLPKPAPAAPDMFAPVDEMQPPVEAAEIPANAVETDAVAIESAEPQQHLGDVRKTVPASAPEARPGELHTVEHLSGDAHAELSADNPRAAATKQASPQSHDAAQDATLIEPDESVQPPPRDPNDPWAFVDDIAATAETEYEGHGDDIFGDWPTDANPPKPR